MSTNIKKSTKHHYVDNKKFTKALSEWAERQRQRKEQGIEREQMTPYIAKCVLDICTNLVRKPNFINYPFKEEMIGDAIENCVKYIANFNGERFNNAFAYTSSIAYSAVIRRIKSEKLLNTRHLTYIKGLVDVNQLSAVVAGASHKEQEHYQGYLNNLQTLIEGINDIEAPKKKAPKKKKEKTILEIMMEEEGEEL